MRFVLNVIIINMLQIFKYPDLVTVTLETFDWSTEAVNWREGLRSVSTMLGVLCVETVSVVMTPELPVDNLETSLVQPLLKVQ